MTYEETIATAHTATAAALDQLRSASSALQSCTGYTEAEANKLVAYLSSINSSVNTLILQAARMDKDKTPTNASS